jgi:hypothetical protein
MLDSAGNILGYLAYLWSNDPENFTELKPSNHVTYVKYEDASQAGVNKYNKFKSTGKAGGTGKMTSEHALIDKTVMVNHLPFTI